MVVMLVVIVNLDVMNTHNSVICWLHELPSGNQTWLDRNPPYIEVLRGKQSIKPWYSIAVSEYQGVVLQDFNLSDDGRIPIEYP